MNIRNNWNQYTQTIRKIKPQLHQRHDSIKKKILQNRISIKTPTSTEKTEIIESPPRLGQSLTRYVRLFIRSFHCFIIWLVFACQNVAVAALPAQLDRRSSGPPTHPPVGGFRPPIADIESYCRVFGKNHTRPSIVRGLTPANLRIEPIQAAGCAMKNLMGVCWESCWNSLVGISFDCLFFVWFSIGNYIFFDIEVSFNICQWKWESFSLISWNRNKYSLELIDENSIVSISSIVTWTFVLYNMFAVNIFI